MGCGETLVKIILFVANVLFALAAIALAAAGVAALLSLKDEGLDGHEARVACAVVIAVGCVAFVIAFLGCCGAIMENRVMLVTYSVLLIILMILKTALAVLVFLTAGALREAAKQLLEKMFKDRNLNDVFSKIEQRLECCGLEGTKSYYYAPPPSCCAEGSYTCTERNVFASGCVAVAGELVQAYAVIVASLCLAVVAVELLAATFGLCLASHVKNRYKGRY